ncbi:MAG: prephenate dehydrogenase, partial [Chloroflexota bacterium]|nr:prephenate dehydrogenase [Chloroflexota bacterium]
DKTHWNLISACEGADLIILAIPVMAIKETLKAIASYLKPGCLVMDTASIKGPVMKWAEEFLPESVSFVGGDPIVGVESEATGLEAAAPDLFQGALYCLTPSPNADPDAVKLATDLVYLLGAQPYFLGAVEHDGLMAGIAHLPFILSAALLRATARAASWREMRKLAGSAFAAGTHFASGDPDTYRDACLLNEENIVHWIDAYRDELGKLRGIIASKDADKLGEVFEVTLVARQKWLRERHWEEAEAPSVSRSSFMDRLFGLRKI